MDTKKWKKIISLLLSAVLLMGIVPMRAVAVEHELPEMIHASWSNPYYDIQIAQPQVPEISGYGLSRVQTYHATASAAAPELKSGLLNKAEVVEFGYLIPVNQFTNDGLGEIAEAVFRAACAHTGVSTEGDYLRWSCGGWRVSASANGYSDDGSCYTAVVSFTPTYLSSGAQDAETTAAVNSLLAQLAPSGTDYEKIKTVYDWMCANISYDYDNLEDSTYLLKHSAYAAIVQKKAVCQGYALLLYRLALEMGVDCRIISGIGNGGAHAWNMVQLGDYYYLLDSTWDAEYKKVGLAYEFFLRGSENFVDHAAEDSWAGYAISAVDYDPEAEEETYVASGTCGENLTWTLDEAGTLTISGTGDMEDYSDANDVPWKQYYGDIVKVVVKNGVASIGDYAFIYCGSAEYIELPHTMTDIGKYAFFGCEYLESIELPEKLTGIGAEAFGGCIRLERICIPDSVSQIGHGAFDGCSRLSSIELPESLTEIEQNMFYYCDSLQRIMVPAKVTTISKQAFYSCSALEEIVLPDGLTSIGNEAFADCTGLLELILPASLKTIGKYAFESCNFRDLYFGGTAQDWADLGTNVPTAMFVHYSCTNPENHWAEEHADPTCDTDGYTRMSCVCGYKRNEVTTPMMGHELADWVVTKEATCTEDGEQRRNCSRCTYFETETIGKTGHSHQPVVTAPTCTEQGYTTHTCTACGDSYVDTYVNALDHKMGSWTTTKAATCTTDGTRRRDCSRCDYYETETIGKTGHSYQSVVTAPTCTEQGYTTHTCTACGDSYADSYEDALNHDLGDWIVTKEPAVGEDGEQRRDCGYCEYFETEKIPALEEEKKPDGWMQENGKWYYYRNGEKLTSYWLKSGGVWYYLDAEGVMATGWAKDGSKWYYFNSSGAMQTGWQKIDGKWYYLNSEMKTGWQFIGSKWYYLGSDGAMKTGWQKIDGKWYYLNSEMKTGWQSIGGKWYYLGSNGAMQTGWQQIGGKWYYLGSNGAMQTGWIQLSGKWYYLNNSGVMVTGTQTINGKTYTFNSSGVWIP